MIELKNFDLEFVDENGMKRFLLRYKGKEINVMETKSLNDEYYGLSVKEVLNVLDSYGVLEKLKNIIINHNRQVNVQGYVSGYGEKRDVLKVNIPSELCLRKFLGSERRAALFVLLHETSHLLGELDEDKANAFGYGELEKFWKKMILE